MCKWCERKPIFYGKEFHSWDNEDDLIESEFYTRLVMGVDKNSRIYIAAYGEGGPTLYPNFCPICGRALAAEWLSI